MSKELLKLWQGIVVILLSISAPWIAWAAGEVSLKATVVLSITAGLGAIKNWLDKSVGEVRTYVAALRAAEAGKAQQPPPPPVIPPPT